MRLILLLTAMSLPARAQYRVVVPVESPVLAAPVAPASNALAAVAAPLLATTPLMAPVLAATALTAPASVAPPTGLPDAVAAAPAARDAATEDRIASAAAGLAAAASDLSSSRTNSNGANDGKDATTLTLLFSGAAARGGSEHVPAPLRSPVFADYRFYRIADRRPAPQGGYAYALEPKDPRDVIPAPQRGSLEDFVRLSPGFAERFGFELHGERLWFEDETALNARIRDLRRRGDPGASFFEVRYVRTGNAQSDREFAGRLLRDELGLTLRGQEPIAGDMFTHDMRTHLPLFLTMPEPIKLWLQRRLRERLNLLDFAEANGSPTLIDCAREELKEEVKRIDTLTANTPLMDPTENHPLLSQRRRVAAYVALGLGGGNIYPNINTFSARVVNLGRDLAQLDQSRLESELGAAAYEAFRRFFMMARSPDITAEQAERFGDEWMRRAHLPPPANSR